MAEIESTAQAKGIAMSPNPEVEKAYMAEMASTASTHANEHTNATQQDMNELSIANKLEDLPAALKNASAKEQTDFLERRAGLLNPDLPKPLARSTVFGVGICGPPGFGKSTILTEVQQRLSDRGVTSTIISYDGTKRAMAADGLDTSGRRPFFRFISRVAEALWRGDVPLVDHCLAKPVAEDLRTMFAAYGSKFVVVGVDPTQHAALAPVWAGRVLRRSANCDDGSTLVPGVDGLSDLVAVRVVGKKCHETASTPLDVVLDFGVPSDPATIQLGTRIIAGRAQASDIDAIDTAGRAPCADPLSVADQLIASTGLDGVDTAFDPLAELPTAPVAADTQIVAIPWGRGALWIGDHVKGELLFDRWGYRTIPVRNAQPSCLGITWALVHHTQLRQLLRRPLLKRVGEALLADCGPSLPATPARSPCPSDDEGEMGAPTGLKVFTPLKPAARDDGEGTDGSDADEVIASLGRAARANQAREQQKDGVEATDQGDSRKSRFVDDCGRPLPRSAGNGGYHSTRPYHRHARMDEIREAIAEGRDEFELDPAPQPAQEVHKLQTVDLAREDDLTVWRLVMAQGSKPLTGWSTGLVDAHKESGRHDSTDYDHASHLLMEGFAEEQYEQFRARCLEERTRVGKGVSWEMATLFRFWSYFLREEPNYLRRSMVAEFRALAWDDAANSTAPKPFYGIECLFRFYAFTLEAQDVPRLWQLFEEDVLRDCVIQRHDLYGLSMLLATLDYMPKTRARPVFSEGLRRWLQRYPTLKALQNRGKDRRAQPQRRSEGSRGRGRGRGRGGAASQASWRAQR
ncbi:hypothetical protein J8273_1765 [Carpediemonas membranifera]|uniref:Uncharacterized protein n=1 Tax=Carpediemonas membranifera TaxID=201153 RepID=A0A8J6BG23_9EUKA|nr:hypothetical protein J8273_1765 [Carpediemonas membranifera]|eukprot:KAG9396747.1 hypothetical protein J8273_1765 [Carpediemonas membranifera]